MGSSARIPAVQRVCRCPTQFSRTCYWMGWTNLWQKFLIMSRVSYQKLELRRNQRTREGGDGTQDLQARTARQNATEKVDPRRRLALGIAKGTKTQQREIQEVQVEAREAKETRERGRALETRGRKAPRKGGARKYLLRKPGSFEEKTKETNY